MFGFGRNRWQRGRRRAPVGLIVLVIAGVFGFEEIAKFEQRRDTWQGTVERAYQERGFLSKRGRPNHYIDVRGDDGQLHTARLYSKDRWSRTRAGDWVTKKAGSLDPD